MTSPIGIWGYPYIDLEPFLDLSALDACHEEICAALVRVELGKTGGSLKWMGVVSEEVQRDPYADAMEVIARLQPLEFADFVSLAEEPESFDLAQQASYRFGDETDHPLTAAQQKWLEYRHGVYFPWKVVHHFVENHRWEDKNAGGGKGFTPESLALFPRTVALLRSLPFQEIGRCLLFGLTSNDHAPRHRDTPPDRDAPVAHCITLVPGGFKRFYLMDPAEEVRLEVPTRAYWFNDMDWHGVEPAPFFQYSIRVDGVFEPSFVERLHARLCR